jgi:hypothetical protein
VNGFESATRAVSDLQPGDRVRWFDTYRTVQSVKPADDGSGHLIVTFDATPAARYAAIARVTVLEITAGEDPS